MPTAVSMGAKLVMETNTAFHRDVKKTARIEVRPNDVPLWAIGKLEEKPIWVLKLACGHVVGPLITNQPPSRMRCQQCASDPMQKMRR